jgi:hypothetical protein
MAAYPPLFFSARKWNQLLFFWGFLILSFTERTNTQESNLFIFFTFDFCVHTQVVND